MNHLPLYSAGEWGSDFKYGKKMDAYLDSHPNSGILAIFTGHGHVFSAFNRSNLMDFVSGSGGGYLDSINDPAAAGTTRVWNGSLEIHGPLTPNDAIEGCMGF